jgi:hypothetical protein
VATRNTAINEPTRVGAATSAAKVVRRRESNWRGEVCMTAFGPRLKVYFIGY